MKKSKTSKNKGSTVKNPLLEQMYQKFLTPMSLEQWTSITNLEQPNLLRSVPTRTAYSTTG